MASKNEIPSAGGAQARIIVTASPSETSSAPAKSGRAGRRRASTGTPPANASPSGATSARRKRAATPALPPVTTGDVIPLLVQLQRRRRFIIKSVNGSISRIDHLIAEEIGFDRTKEKSKKAAFTKARAYRAAVEARGEGYREDDDHAHFALAALDPLILAELPTRDAYGRQRDGLEAEMRRLACLLPGADFVAAVRGLDWLGFGVLAAESGIPFADWRTVSGLWKHMGMAVIDGARQRGIAGKRKDETEARKLFHPKERRGEIYTFLQDSMFRAQWRGPRLMCDGCGKRTEFETREDGAPACKKCGMAGTADRILPAHPIGPYGAVCGRRRAATAHRVAETAHLESKDPKKWPPARCKNDATRVMAKALLRDLWRVSRGLPPRGCAELDASEEQSEIPGDGAPEDHVVDDAHVALVLGQSPEIPGDGAPEDRQAPDDHQSAVLGQSPEIPGNGAAEDRPRTDIHRAGVLGQLTRIPGNGAAGGQSSRDVPYKDAAGQLTEIPGDGAAEDHTATDARRAGVLGRKVAA